MTSKNEITINEISTGILIKSTNDIFRPTKTNIVAKPYFRYVKYFSIPANAKYNERSPRMANTFEV